MCMMGAKIAGLQGKALIPVTVQMAGFACNADGSKPQWQDLNAATSAWPTIAWYSSNPWSTTQASRRWGQLIVLMALYDRSGNCFVGSLERALRAGVGWATHNKLTWGLWVHVT